jgi:hypothetical protein
MTTMNELFSPEVITEQERMAWANGDTVKAAMLGALMDVTEEKDETEKQSSEAANKLQALLGAVDELLSAVSTMQDEIAGIIDLKTKAERNTEWKNWDAQMETALDQLRAAHAKADAE